MAQRLSFDERARVEAMSAAGVSVATAARCLGRHRSTVHRELRRGRRGGVYDAEAAQAAAAVGAARPKIPVLAADPELAASVREGLKGGWSPHAICAALRAEGRTVSAETIYRAAYDHSGSSGLPEGSWRCLPSRRDTLPVNVVTLPFQSTARVTMVTLCAPERCSQTAPTVTNGSSSAATLRMTRRRSCPPRPCGPGSHCGTADPPPAWRTVEGLATSVTAV